MAWWCFLPLNIRLHVLRLLDSWTYIPAICQELSGLRPQTEGSTIGFSTFEVLRLGLASWLLSLRPVVGLHLVIIRLTAKPLREKSMGDKLSHAAEMSWRFSTAPLGQCLDKSSTCDKK
ncbi:uncharacterized protein [Macaca nemestrina]|uniref:uncharacterized protein isoform X2 n=1 Tax=Macaca nemestrina TaxID=9545 RepID=UPI0039B98F9C